METLSLDMLLLLTVAAFVAAFIDSTVGGGGLISLPALLFAGLPPQLALGTNKLSASFSSLTSTVSFLFSGKIDRKLVSALFPVSFVGSALGTYTVTLLPSGFLKPLVVILLTVMTVYTLARKNWGMRSAYKGLTFKTAAMTGLATFAIGFYDGFFGPGTGSFFIFVMLLTGFDFLFAAGNAKVLNFASNLASLIMFGALGSIHYGYGIPMGIAMIAGALAGSRVAIRKGTAYVKPLFIAVTAILIGKQLWDLIAPPHHW